jgi:hypothetical protein
MGRKTAMSIDDIRCKKDLEIRCIRDKYHKVSKDLKDLKDSKDRLEVDQRSPRKSEARRIKSSKYLRPTSESEEFTFELSSER